VTRIIEESNDDAEIALSFHGRDYTRADLKALTGGLATILQDRGVRRGDRIALMSSNRPEFVAALYASWSIGAVVALFSPAWKRAEVQHALTLTEVCHAVGDSPVLAGATSMLSLDDPIPMRSGDLVRPQDDSDAVFVFSSGTTGMPKAVRHTHNTLTAAINQWRTALELSAADRLQVLTPPSHILGLLNIATAIEVGVWIRLHRRFDVDTMLATIEGDRITIEMAVAPIALALAAHPALESYDLSSLRFMIWGATPFAPSVARAVTRRTGIRWVTAYGASELPVITCNPLDDVRLDTVGRRVAGVDLRIVSPETGKPVSPGEPGEIQARSASTTVGYLPADATPEVFCEGWYRTGDVGRLDTDGYLRITDRLKEMIKVRGFQVAPAEVEAILHSHSAVADCAAFGVPDDADGEAIIVAVERSGNVEADELIALVSDQLASYKKPRGIAFVDTVPRLPSGKVLRRVLKAEYLAST
jgi:long-chain acyl-CoA synthetase